MASGRSYIRARVRLQIDLPLKDKKELLLLGLGKVEVLYVYERLNRICTFCGCIGHDVANCKLWLRITKLASDPRFIGKISQNDANPYKLGKWMMTSSQLPPTNTMMTSQFSSPHHANPPPDSHHAGMPTMNTPTQPHGPNHSPSPPDVMSPPHLGPKLAVSPQFQPVRQSINLSCLPNSGFFTAQAQHSSLHDARSAGRTHSLAQTHSLLNVVNDHTAGQSSATSLQLFHTSAVEEIAMINAAPSSHMSMGSHMQATLRQEMLMLSAAPIQVAGSSDVSAMPLDPSQLSDMDCDSPASHSNKRARAGPIPPQLPL